MIAEHPSYDLIKATAKVGIKKPEDYPWVEIALITNNKAFCKYGCSCIKGYSSKLKTPEEEIEVILKPYTCAEHKKKITYYIGQCCRCKKIYWCEENSQ